jgi:hypothetical protein
MNALGQDHLQANPEQEGSPQQESIRSAPESTVPGKGTDELTEEPKELEAPGPVTSSVACKNQERRSLPEGKKSDLILRSTTHSSKPGPQAKITWTFSV